MQALEEPLSKNLMIYVIAQMCRICTIIDNSISYTFFVQAILDRIADCEVILHA